MKTLPLTFRADRFNFTQLTRSGDLAIYRKEKPATNYVGFEVIRIQRHNGFEIKGRKVEPTEFYPGNEKWGVDGFTCMTEARAQEKLAELLSLSAKNATPEKGPTV